MNLLESPPTQFDLAAYLQMHTQVVSIHGDEHVVPCMCDANGDKAHLWVNVVKHKAICYRCGIKHSDLTGILMQIGALSRAEAKKMRQQQEGSQGLWLGLRTKLAQEFNETKRESWHPTLQLPQEFEPIQKPSDVPRYLQARGVTFKDCTTYGLGVCQSGFYKDRVIVPIHNVRGALVSFVARTMGKAEPKVLYPKGSKTGRVLFNESRATGWDTVIAVEGVFDAIRVGENGVALFGKNATRMQITRLGYMGQTRKLVVMLDDDAAQEARALTRALARTCPDVWLATLPKGRHDPGECQDLEVWQAVQDAERIGDRKTLLSKYLGVPLPAMEPAKRRGS